MVRDTSTPEQHKVTEHQGSPHEVRMNIGASIQHLALHLAKDAGLLAAAAEKLDHPNERAEGIAAFEAWMRHRHSNVEKTLQLLNEFMVGRCSDCRKEWSGAEIGNTCPFCNSSRWLALPKIPEEVENHA